MSGHWAGANHKRQKSLPRNWPSLRRRALRRCRGRCEWIEDDGRRCTEAASDVDHIRPHSAGGGDALANLQGLCRDHHNAKTAREGGAARGRQRSGQAAKAVRPRELSPLEAMAERRSRE